MSELIQLKHGNRKADAAVNEMCLVMYKKPAHDCSVSELEGLVSTLKALKAVSPTKYNRSGFLLK